MSRPKNLTPATLPPAPSARDLEIYKCVIVLHQNQCTISRAYNLQQPRISQIIAKVRRWLAAGGATSDPSIRDHFAQQNLSRAAQKMRLQGIIDRATYAMENQLSSEVTTKSRHRGLTEIWREETRHLAPDVNLPAMRLLLRAVKTLDDLETRYDEPASSQKASPPSDENLIQLAFDILCHLRARAERAGRVPPCPDIRQLVADVLTNCLGGSIGLLDVGRASGRPESDEADRAADLPSPSNPLLIAILNNPQAIQTTTNNPANISPPSQPPVVSIPELPPPSNN